MPRSINKGPFVDYHLERKVDAAVANNSKRPDQDMVTPLHDRPRHGRTYSGRAQRAAARTDPRYREHGRPQVGGVRSYSNLSRDIRATARPRSRSKSR